ncbi:hypothetical protein FRC17_001886, partial [Serendipita sp. 399]
MALAIRAMAIYHGLIYYSELVKGCQATVHLSSIAAVFYAPAAFETFVFGMTVYSAIQDSQFITGAFAPFLVMLYRDGFIFFLVMIGLRVWNCWIYMTQPSSGYAMGIP